MIIKSEIRSDGEWVRRWDCAWEKVMPCSLCGSTIYRTALRLRKKPINNKCSSCHGAATIRAAGKVRSDSAKGWQQKGYLMRSVNGKNTLEHTIIAEKILGRSMRKGEAVHHINGVKSDNRNVNLVICTRSYNSLLHDRMSQLYQKKHFTNREGQ